MTSMTFAESMRMTATMRMKVPVVAAADGTAVKSRAKANREGMNEDRSPAITGKAAAGMEPQTAVVNTMPAVLKVWTAIRHAALRVWEVVLLTAGEDAPVTETVPTEQEAALTLQRKEAGERIHKGAFRPATAEELRNVQRVQPGLHRAQTADKLMKNYFTEADLN